VTGPTLRPSSPADLDGCVAVWLRSLEARDGAPPPAGTAARVRARLQRPEQWSVVADQAGAVVGFATLLPDGEAALLLQYVAVDPDHSGQGLGRLLLAHAIDRTAGLEVRLDVRIGNARAIALYEAAGFTRTGAAAPHPLGGEPMARYVRPARAERPPEASRRGPGAPARGRGPSRSS
jgi:ribosomal protein S18 acetylase RimI-like enzyme